MIQLPAPFTLAQARFAFTQGWHRQWAGPSSDLELGEVIRDLGLRKHQ